MKENLFGVPIDRDQGKLGEQVYQILLSEIRQQRWGEGEKLPAYAELTESSCVSRSVLQAVFKRLANEGFVTTVPKKGIFLKKGACSNVRTAGTVALLITDGVGHDLDPYATTSIFGRLLLGRIKAIASEHGLLISLHHIGKNGELFPEIEEHGQNPLRGIISCSPAAAIVEIRDRLSQDYPVVYLGLEDPFSFPRITADIFYAGYLLAKHLLDLGHTKIGVLSDPSWNRNHFHQAWQGHLQALAEYGATPDTDLYAFLQDPAPMTMARIKSFLETFSEQTAIITYHASVTETVADVAELLGIRIPEDLSVASLQPGPAKCCEKWFAGTSYPWSEVLCKCFELLDLQNADMGVPNVLYTPGMHEFDTFSTRSI
ncbi:MAG TPA: hypothetical protein DCR55_06325 [Lentisphaeria bacterium]|nr:hypothetical protein [Lentisphaeria bacterium]